MTASSPTAPLPTLLIVDDEEEILVALTDLFEDEYKVVAFSSPLAALDAIPRLTDLAVVLSDQRMPELPGNVFLSRARPRTDAEFILLTGYADLSAVVSAINDGAISGYATKPWDAGSLRASVAAAAERQRLRRALAFEQAAFRGLADNSPDKVVVIDAAGRTLRANTAGSQTPHVMDADDRAAIESGQPSQVEAETGSPGEERWHAVRRIPFEVSGTRHLLRIQSDETDRRHAMRRQHQSEKLEALGTLAGGIAHDFNNLLAAIVGNLELCERVIDKPERLARFLRHATEAAGRGSAITRRLLSFSRQRDLAAETFQPEAAIRAVEELVVRGTAGRVRLAFDFEAAGWSVRTDPGQFELAVLNLCVNARDAMGGSGEIRIETRNVADPAEVLPGILGPHVRISVIDRGSGMSDAVRARVFEPFFTTKDHGVGTGLGLPMVRAMAEAAGGRVSVDTAPGQGTSIHLWLPRAEAVEAAEIAPELQADQAPLAILVAEDDAEVREVVVAHLGAAGHRVTAVESAEAALRALRSGLSVDLLVTDYAMPRMTGVELSREAQAICPGLPALLVTGFADLAETQASLPVVTKPFSASALRAGVVAAVSRSEPA